MASAQTDKFSLFIFKLNFEGGFEILRINKSLAQGQTDADWRLGANELIGKLSNFHLVESRPSFVGIEFLS